MRIIVALAIAMFSILGCGDGEQAAPKKCHVVMEGDSIKNQAGQTIAQFLPNCTIENKGVDASILADVVNPVMVFDADTVYTFSFGANECLGQRVSVDDYRATLNHVAIQGRGHKLIFEAPWNLTHTNCDAEPYRQAVIDVGLAHGVPVVIENGREHIGDDIHLTGAHTTERERLLSIAIIGLL